MSASKNYWKKLLTGLIVLLAVAVVLFKYQDYVLNPWTRDGMVRAQVVQIAPRVSGPIVNLPIKDNQPVKSGDLLFEIDSSTYLAAVQQAEAAVEHAKAKAKASLDREQRAEHVRKSNPGAVSLQELESKRNSRLADDASVKESQASLKSAQLNQQFTRVTAPVDGYVTNLTLRVGSQVVSNSPALALVDTNSYWIHGFFRENTIRNMRKGDRAIVTLMTYNDRPLEGVVDSLGWGVAQQDGSTGFDLLPTISPTFEWIRLAQRIPVRIHLTSAPDDIALRVGTTASVLIMTGSSKGKQHKPVAAPALLQ